MAAIGGDTWTVNTLVPLRRLGAAATSTDTFMWEGRAKVYVCTQPWTAAHVQQLLEAAIAQNMPQYSVRVTAA